ncbi:TolC family protein [Sulfurimonas microaerophilic]|uniref:TolC family protein n=1 Tax=Sulfurimonas microaerophilic TaxID=3058392 RepID=UPI002714E097|nr:TolC family protein [Sulfurimonas sp. hsl 1-7]
MRRLLLFLVAISFLDAKELFKSTTITQYLNETNPFVYPLLNQEYVAKERVNYHQSAFDTTLSAKYDHKEYPASTGEYYDIAVKKPIENGMEFIATYRKAEGTQEYNNIKTGDEGEVLVGVKMPINALLQGTNTKKTNLDLALIESSRTEYSSNNNLRLFYLKVLNNYHRVLYNKLLVKYEKELLQKAQKRKSFIEQKIDSGLFPKIALIEAEQQLINRKQRYLAIGTEYENSFENFVKYLNISKETFLQKYDFVDVLKTPVENILLSNAINEAKQNRPDLKMLEYEKEKLFLEKKNANLLQYPEVNVALYGVHDFKYDNGFKLSFDLAFPIERNRYKAQLGTIGKSLTNIEKLQQQKEREIKTSLTNIINSLNLLKQNIDNAQTELTLATQLENAENKKYLVGSSNLFVLNQREIQTLEIKKKVLQYKLNYLLLKEELNAQVGKFATLNPTL